MLQISSNFDGGAIIIIDPSDPANIRLRLRDDNVGDFRQWFYFRVSGMRGLAPVFRIENASESSYPDGWPGYQACMSYDREHWFRIPNCRYDGRTLTFSFNAKHDTVWIAYFEPYSYERHQALIGRAGIRPGVSLRNLGSSVQGRPIDALQFGERSKGRRNVWIVCRQHPGEAMAEWFAEGLIERLLDAAEPVAREVRRLACITIVPNINPDGSVLGNLRSNAVGVNLNREWHAPSLQRSPEVLCVRNAMEATGVDLFLDIHGDEALPYVFIDGSQMVPGYGELNTMRQGRFLNTLAVVSPDFQRRHGYTDDRFKNELLQLASKWVADRFGCVSMTLEMPFKDNADAPDSHTGWNGKRSKRMGAAMLHPILGHLRDG
ncbi:MAG: M14-type cytosolic carboxypeptidase [Betaproteobacteria bacterium]|nr:M14-type cytosolic carboxypeptidase [Betaproteobacteria bacterium]